MSPKSNKTSVDQIATNIILLKTQLLDRQGNKTYFIKINIGYFFYQMPKSLYERLQYKYGAFLFTIFEDTFRHD